MNPCSKTGRAGRLSSAMRGAGAIAMLWAAAAAAPAFAQLESSTIIQPSLPPDYDRGRNVGVIERARPDYDPLGIRAGAFLIFPRVDLGLGYTDNVLLTPSDEQSDGFGVVGPSVRAQSDWSRHELKLSGGGRFRRYFDESRRNQDEWFVNSLGRVDVGSDFALTAEGQAARVQEEPFTGEADSNVAALSRYRRNLAALRGTFTQDRLRALVALDYQDFTFSDVELSSGVAVSQANRDRDIQRISGRVEYAISPSTAVYGQLAYSDINYDNLLAPGVANRDSDGYRAIAGVSMDVSGFFRGIVGVGYTRRNYSSPTFEDVSGFSGEARLEYFPTELTTVTASFGRTLEDSNLGGASAFFDTRAGLRVDHELRRNVILSAGADYVRQKYIGVDERNNIWRLQSNGRFLMSRLVSLQAGLSYGRRRRYGGTNDFTISETAGTITLMFQR